MNERPARPVGSPRRVVLDANVLVPNALRDTLLRAAEAGLYEVRWSATTLDELERTLLARTLAAHPDRAERVRRLLAAMRAAFPLATVAEDVAVIARRTTAPKDRHVLAAAVQSGARTIVTNNLRDFPPTALRPHRVTVRTPDRFLQDLFRLATRAPGRDPGRPGCRSAPTALARGGPRYPGLARPRLRPHRPRRHGRRLSLSLLPQQVAIATGAAPGRGDATRQVMDADMAAEDADADWPKLHRWPSPRIGAKKPREKSVKRSRNGVQWPGQRRSISRPES